MKKDKKIEKITNILTDFKRTKIEENSIIDLGYNKTNVVKEYMKILNDDFYIKLIYSPMGTILPDREWIVTVINNDGEPVGSMEISTLEDVNKFINLLGISDNSNLN